MARNTKCNAQVSRKTNQILYGKNRIKFVKFCLKYQQVKIILSLNGGLFNNLIE